MKPKWRDALFLLGIVPVIAGSYWGLKEIESLTQSELASSLQTVLLTTRNGLKIWAQDNRDLCNSLAGLPLARKVAKILVQSSPKNKELHQQTIQEFVREYSAVAKKNLALGVALISPSGVQVAATEMTRIGGKEIYEANDQTLETVLNSGETRIGMPYSVHQAGFPDGRVELIVASPIKDERQKIIAAFVLIVNPALDFTAMTLLGRIGKTGETYAINDRGKSLTTLRFMSDLQSLGAYPPSQASMVSIAVKDPGVNLYQQPQPVEPKGLPWTQMASSIMERKSGENLKGYRDYRGVEVVGAWLWDPDLGFGLATEQDTAEAFAPLRLTRRLVLIILMITIASATVVMALLFRARIRLEDALNYREQFVAIASHELKTPITALKPQIELLARAVKQGRIESYSPEKLAKIFETSLRQIDRLQRLVSDLFDLTRFKKGRPVLTLSKVELSPLIENILERYKPQLTEAGYTIHLQLQEGIIGFWDHDRLDQVISNLISNAIRYGAKKPVTITTSTQDHQVEIKIKDEGIGIDLKDQARIFEPFERAPETRKMGGLGLGLYIIKKIVEAHGGTITLQSQPKLGSTFTVWIPLVTTASD